MPERDQKRRGPKPVHAGRIMLRIAPETIDKIDAKVGKKFRSAFIRQAIDRELKRRERPTPKSLTPR